MTDRISLSLAQADPEVAAALDQETLRQHEGLEMIASENFVSEAVLEAAGSISPISMPRATQGVVTTADASMPMSSRISLATAPNSCLERNT